MPPFLAILEAIALNPQIDASIGSLVTSIATHLITNSSQPENIKQLGMQMIASSGQIVSAVLASTPHAPKPPA